MERYSAYRDPGTGIQPFLTPLAPAGTDVFLKCILPIRYVLGTVRTAMILLIAIAYFITRGVCIILYPILPLYGIFDHFVIYALGRMALFIIGIFWISVEQFNRRRSKGQRLAEKWSPEAGDIIVSNWVSWLEIIWLTIRFNPTFVLPIPDSLPETPKQSLLASTPITQQTRRRTAIGLAELRSKTVRSHIPIRGFQEVSFLKMVSVTGRVPPFGNLHLNDALSLEEIRRKSSKPIVVFPECTSSNGRGLLRFASVFRQTVPTKNYQVFVMSVRYDPPKVLATTLSHSLPSNILNPVSHLFSVATSLLPAQITIRLLAPSESPGSQLFMASEILSDYSGDDQLSETCAILIAQMGKMKRTGLGWEDKSNLLEFYRTTKND